MDSAIDQVNTQRAGYGAEINSYESRIRDYMIQSENLVASESRIRDVDMASEVMKMTIAGMQMLARSNLDSATITNLLPT